MIEIGKIMVTGGTGFIGSALAKFLVETGERVVIPCRRPQKDTRFEYIPIPSASECFPTSVFEKCLAVVNLAGQNVAKTRWNEQVKQSIKESRIYTTRLITRSIKEHERKQLPYPKILINASAIGYYGSSEFETFDENSLPGRDFLATVCKEWEEEACEAEQFGVRVVRLRFGHVLEGDGGMLPKVAEPFRYNLGGFIGTGRQWMSWIHRQDVISMIFNAIEKDLWSGPYNACAPNPVMMKDFTDTLGKVLKKKAWTRMPSSIVRIMFGEMGDNLLLKGQRVVPRRVVEMGFQFQFPYLSEALEAIYRSD